MAVKRILVLTYYYYPDLSAGSFRNTALANLLAQAVEGKAIVEVIATQPNRYKSFRQPAPSFEEKDNLVINRIDVPEHASGFKDQVLSYINYYRKAKKIAKNKKYDLVYATSSRLFTCYLGKRVAKENNCPLYLDVRDIFVENMEEMFGKNPAFKYFMLPAIKQFVEKSSFNAAKHINLVSEGFKPYFKQFAKANYSYFPNGIDDVFLTLQQRVDIEATPKVITYAGNIGDGQGLEKVVPKLAAILGDDYLIRIIGDGGTKQKLKTALQENNVANVELLEPVKRDELISYYQSSHYLFLHLNTLKAFERVLPSKIFEYGASNIPVIAGVGGFAASFIRENVSNSFVTEPCNAEALANWIKETGYQIENRNNFKEKFNRDAITKQLVNSILQYIKL